MTVLQDGDYELTVTFDVADLDAVTEVLKPKRRRRLSPEQRAEAVPYGRVLNSGGQVPFDGSDTGS